MSKFAINPNAIPDLAEEQAAALDRDRAAIHHFDDDGAGDAVQANDRPGLTPLGPLMVTPDPRYRHGDIDAVEAQLALAKAVREEAAALTRPPAPRKATEHPLIATLIATLPAPGGCWPVAEREIWLNAARSIFDMAYAAVESDDEAPEAS
ncbi:MAG: hypothetical protein V9G24_17395 [Rhodoblastus sp.]